MGCNLIPEGSGANTTYYIQLGADTASKKLLGNGNYKISCRATGVFEEYYVNQSASTFTATFDVVIQEQKATINNFSSTYSGTLYAVNLGRYRGRITGITVLSITEL